MDRPKYAQHADLLRVGGRRGPTTSRIASWRSPTRTPRPTPAFAAALKLPRDTDDEQRGPRRRPSGRGRAARRRGPARAASRPASELVGDRRGARRPQQRQRLERPQRRRAPRRGRGPWRRGERAGQPAVGRRPRVRGDDDASASTSSSTTIERLAVADPRGRRQRRAARARSGAGASLTSDRPRGARLLEGGADRRGDPDGGRRGRRDVHRRPGPAARPGASSSSARTRRRPSTSSGSCAAAPRSGSTAGFVELEGEAHRGRA